MTFWLAQRLGGGSEKTTGKTTGKTPGLVFARLQEVPQASIPELAEQRGGMVAPAGERTPAVVEAVSGDEYLVCVGGGKAVGVFGRGRSDESLAVLAKNGGERHFYGLG